MDKNQGYAILKAVMLENGRGFALGEHPTAPSPYVTWACYDDDKGQRQYEWGHYGNDLAAMEKDLTERVQDYQRMYHVKIVQTEVPIQTRKVSGIGRQHTSSYKHIQIFKHRCSYRKMGALYRL